MSVNGLPRPCSEEDNRFQGQFRLSLVEGVSRVFLFSVGPG